MSGLERSAPLEAGASWRAPARAWDRLRRPDPATLTTAVVVLLIGTWLSEGLRSVVGLPHKAVGLVDLSEFALWVWLAHGVWRERPRRLLALAGAFTVLVLSGLIGTGAPAASIVTSLKDSLLLPLLALLIAHQGASERRARAVVATLFALCALEFVLSAGQLLSFGLHVDPDYLVGSFGPSANAVIGMVMLLTACVGFAGFLLEAPRGRAALLAAVTLPIVSAWAAIKLMTIVLPLVALAVAVPLLLLGLTPRRRALTCFAASLASTVLVIGSYAALNPSSFDALNPFGNLGNYLVNSSVAGSGAAQPVAVVGAQLVFNYDNAAVRAVPVQPPGATGVVIENVQPGDFTMGVAEATERPFSAVPGRTYGFSVRDFPEWRPHATLQAQILWMDGTRRLATTLGHTVSADLAGRGSAVVSVTGSAPAGATGAVPKVAVTGDPPAGTRLLFDALQWTAGGQFARLGDMVLGNYDRAAVASAPGARRHRVFVVSGTFPGAYTAWVAAIGGHAPQARAGHTYELRFAAASAAGLDQVLQPQIGWRGRGQTLAVARGPKLRLARPGGGPRVFALRATAPPGSSAAVPKIAVLAVAGVGRITVGSISFGALRPGSAGTPAAVGSPAAAAGSPAPPRHATSAPSQPAQASPAKPSGTVSEGGRTATSGGGHTASSGGGQTASSGGGQTANTTPAAAAIEVPPGHLAALRQAIDGVSGSPATFLFGEGLGSATAAVGLGGTTRAFTRSEYAASFSDAGTILVERGWVGIVLAVLAAVGLSLIALRRGRRLPRGRWTTALTLAIPGAVLVMAGYGLTGTPLQNRSAALTFWLIVGLGLAGLSGRTAAGAARGSAAEPEPEGRSRAGAAVPEPVTGRGSWGAPPVPAPVRVTREAPTAAGLARGVRARAAANRDVLVVLGVLTLVAIVLRLLFLERPLSYDEAYTFETYTTRAFRSIASTYNVPNNQILFTLASHLAWRLFGNHLWVLRLAAFLPGCLLVPAGYLAARELYGRGAALWSAALIATAAPLIDYSVNGRGYELGLFLLMLMLWAAARQLRMPTRAGWVALAVTGALAAYAVPTNAFGAVTIFVWLAAELALRRDRRALVSLGVTVAAGALLGLALYAPVFGQPGWSFNQPLVPAWGPVTHLIAGVWADWNRAAPHPADWLLAAGFLIALGGHRRLARHAVPLPAAAVAVLVAVVLFGPIAPFVRSWLYLLPLYLIVAAAGLDGLTRELGGRLGGLRPGRREPVSQARRGFAPGHPVPVLAVVAMVVLIGAGVIAAGQSGADEPPTTANDLVAFVKAELAPGEALAVDRFMLEPADYYFARADYLPPLLTPQRIRTGHHRVLALLIGDPGPAAAEALVSTLAHEPGLHATASLTRRLTYLTAYTVRVSPPSSSR